MIVTKYDVIKFVESFGDPYHIDDYSIRTAVYNIYEQLERYILFGKPSSYELKDWEYNECFSKKGSYSDEIDKIKSIEPMFLNWVRDNKINKIIECQVPEF